METLDPTPETARAPEAPEPGQPAPGPPETGQPETGQHGPEAPEAERPPELSTAEAVAPPVVAVLVTSDPGPWLDDALASLAAQEYPALSVLVVDNGSAVDLTPRIATTMPRAFVRRLESNVGFAAAANDAMAAVEGATFVLFCHDDVALSPDALRIMVEEAYRSNAGIVGPKVVDYDTPEILLEVGMAIDHYGVPFSGIERGEVDQEQHDAVRDVFFVSNAAMLVRADLFHELGGFDAATFPGSDDLDLCWRGRLAGARILVAPDARVRHRRATVQDERPARSNDVGPLKAWTSSRVRVLMKSYSAPALFWVIPIAFFLDVLEAIALLLTGRVRRARGLIAGWFSAVAQGSGVRRARAETQALRRVDDGDVRDLMVRGSARMRTFVSSRLHAGDRMADVSIRTRAAVSEAGTRARTFPVVAATILVALLAFGSRSLIFDRVALVGAFQDWPGAGGLWSTFLGSWRTAMMGADTAASPVFAMMAVLTTALFGDSDLGRTLVVAGALPLGALGAYRLMRPFARTTAPAVAAMAAYLINPIARNAIAEGLLGPLVCYALAPFVMRALVNASRRDAARTTKVHATLTVALLLLTAVAFWPPALLLALFVAAGWALAWPLVGGTRIVASAWVVGGLATLGAAVLALPWLVTLVGADAATLGLLPRGPMSFADVVSFHTGRSGAGFGALGLLVAAALPLAVATGSRLAWAGRAWMLALLSFACTWLPARLDVEASVPAPEGLLVPAALGLAVAVGLGVAAFLEDLRTFHFGWRQFAAVAAAIGIALPVIGFAADTLDGRFGLPEDDWPSRFAWMDEERENGDFKVLWVGDPAIMPTDAKVVDGVGYGLTRQGPGDARALWSPPVGDAERILASAIAQARDGATVRFGHLIAPTGARYVAFATRAAPDAGARGRRDPLLAESLGSQLDLAVSRLEPGAVVYENQAWIPGRAVVPPDTELAEDTDDPLAAAQRVALPGVTAVTGPESGSDPAGPGTLLWAESANSGWRALGERRARLEKRRVRLDECVRTGRHGQHRRVVLRRSASRPCHRAAAPVDRCDRPVVAHAHSDPVTSFGRARARGRRAGKRTRAGRERDAMNIRRLPIVIVLLVAALGAVLAGNASAPASRESTDELDATQLAARSARTSGWFCPGLPAAAPLEAQVLILSNIGTDDAEAAVTVFPDDGSAPVAQTVAVPAAGITRLVRATIGPAGGVVVEAFSSDVVVEQGVESSDLFADGPCASAAATDWHFAAGTTGNFEANTTGRPVDNWLVLFNPFGTDARVEVTVRANDSVPQVLQTIDVPRRVRVLVPLHEQAVRKPQVGVAVHASVGRVVASQSMVFGEQSGFTGITLSLGATRPSSEWTFAYGASTASTRTVVALVNTGMVDTEADVIVSAAAAPLTVPVKRDAVVWVQIGGCADPPAENCIPVGADVSYTTLVATEEDTPIVAEQIAFYGEGAVGEGVATVMGAPRPTARAVLPSIGATAGRNGVVAIANPGVTPVSVDLTIVRGGVEERPEGTQAIEIPANGQSTFDITTLFAAGDGAVVAEASGPIAMVRSAYTSGDITRSAAVVDSR